MIGTTDQVQDEIVKAAEALARIAYANGFVVTIETEPRKPLRMGNYDAKVTVRPSHPAYRSVK